MGLVLAPKQSHVLPDMEELSFTDSELDYHVRNALKAAVQGDRDFYNQLVAVMHHKERLVPEEVALLVLRFEELEEEYKRQNRAQIAGDEFWEQKDKKRIEDRGTGSKILQPGSRVLSFFFFSLAGT
ncbi:RNA polymerase I-specific transcription initiation factor RRN3 [Abeliophyllum distichum]|uniref:RNA polymerase I-specific transcription initiation factor RRN3 n=1 Tax=Abeliophyllum distichum TaxID=126358 RepID=A0ABD1VAL0_9LAMI